MEEKTTAESSFTAPTPEELDALLPDYSVSELLGQGGMGAVYRGIQLKLDRNVAIKVLPKTFGADLNFAARFEGEAKAMAKLTHNNIVSVFDYGETSDGGLLFFCMEFVEGTDLQHVIYVDEPPVAHKLSYLGQICDALAYAHSNGIIHRDIKPENILIDKSGMIKVADFGLARVDQASIENGVELGTPDYMAPEVLEPDVAIDHRADIFSMGVLIYQTLTGKLPTAEAPLASSLGFDIRFDDLIAKAMQYDRDARYQTITELKAALGAIAKSPPPAKKTATRKAGGPIVVARKRPVASGGRRTLPPVPQKSGSPVGLIIFIVVAVIVIIGLLIAVANNENKPPPAGPPKSDGPFRPEIPGSEDVKIPGDGK